MEAHDFDDQVEWRTDNDVRCVIFAMDSTAKTKIDRVIGVMDTQALAQRVVDDHNLVIKLRGMV